MCSLKFEVATSLLLTLNVDADGSCAPLQLTKPRGRWHLYPAWPSQSHYFKKFFMSLSMRRPCLLSNWGTLHPILQVPYRAPICKVPQERQSVGIPVLKFILPCPAAQPAYPLLLQLLTRSGCIPAKTPWSRGPGHPVRVKVGH